MCMGYALAETPLEPPKLLQYVEFSIIFYIETLLKPFWIIPENIQDKFWYFSEFSENPHFLTSLWHFAPCYKLLFYDLFEILPLP